MEIKSFRGDFAFLSNFYPCMVEYEGVTFPSSEHAFQAAKTLDINERMNFRYCESPALAKSLGRKVKLRPDWDDIRDDVMYQVVKSKFTRNEHLKEKLLATGDALLEEGNNHGDRYWGTVGGVGNNQLGKTLMRVRKELREE